MSRRRFVWDPERNCTVEVTPEYVGQRRLGGHTSEAEVYGNLTATDGTDLSSRRKHREYMAHHGLAMADDFKGSWARAAAERETERAAAPAAGAWVDPDGPAPRIRGDGPRSRRFEEIRRAVAENLHRSRR